MPELSRQLHDLEWGVQRSIRYHHRRSRFFDHLHTISTFIAALAGTATFATVLADMGRGYILTSAVIVAVFSVLDLVIGCPQSARLHADLARKYFELQKKINEVIAPTQEVVTSLVNARLDIEKDEPPVLKALDSICHNELLRARGDDSKNYVHIAWHKRLLANIVDVGEHNIRPTA